MFQNGDFVEVDGILAVVVGSNGDNGVPEDHLAVWFGEPQGTRLSEGGTGNLTPIVWTVPVDCCRQAIKPEIRH